jgi:hypothetical protein
MLSANDIARIVPFLPMDDQITIERRPISRGIKIDVHDKAFYLTLKMKDGTILKDEEILKRFLRNGHSKI